MGAQHGAAGFVEAMQVGLKRKPGTVERGVLFGHDDVLFLADGGHNVLDYLLGMRRASEQSFDNFEQNITTRRDAAARAGAGYLHVVFPDKESVMTRECPVRNPVHLGDVYMERCPQLASDVFYPRQFLQDAGPGMYMTTDTHASDIGNILATAAIVERLTGAPQTEAIARLMQGPWDETHVVGDLGGRFEPPFGETNRLVRRRWISKWLHNDLQGGNNGIVDILFNTQAVYPKRALVFGDSFARTFCSLMSYFFKEILFLRTPYFHPDFLDQFQPDYVVTENVERYLSYCFPDTGRPSFFTFPYLENKGYAPSREFAAALSAVLSHGRPPYRDYLASHGLEG